ncbi:MAG: ATP-binding protein [bacterium]|nr:ATP-binding protein [bacterium]
MEQTFTRNIDALDQIFAFTGRFVEDERLNENVAYSIDLAVEELFTNMVKYNTGTSKNIAILIDREKDEVVLQLMDFDVEPFDPTSPEDIDTDLPLEARKPGGLGLHLVKSVVDKITYEYKDRTMKVTVSKSLS